MTYLIRCIICDASFPRHDTGSKSVSWLQEYRAVYYTSPSLSEVRLSGVGLRRSTDKTDYFTVPVVESERWDNEGYLPIDVPVLKDEDGQYGFVFHDFCWLLLKERFQRRTFSLDRLIEVLNSVPWEQWGNYSWSGERYYAWEHGYHGLVEFDHKNYYPWESAGWQQVGGLRTIQIDTIDPCTVNGIQKLLDSPSVLPPDVGKRKGRIRNNFTPSTTSTAAQRASANEQRTPRNDCFTQLPYEMVEEIAAHLPTSSVLSLRLISPEFTPLFHSQSFWATRFQAGRERGFLFEIWQDPKRRDWRTLYYLTNPTNLPRALQNRKRVWDLVESLGQKVSLGWADSSTRHSH